MLAGADTLHHRAGARIETRAGLAEFAEQVPGIRPVLDVFVDKQKADARAFGIVGRNLALVEIGLCGEELGEIGMRLRHVAGRHNALVVNEGDRLMRRAVGLVLPYRPFRKIRNFGRSVG